ncbi:hypothetical protein V6N12_026923 [Hibiscus sabdariffa]|uniref:Uncharacterized protein n=1 Tax=Hibiscus sabdariffa TaxID=183260 RepID=A0ABR2DWF4_9ROSI
METNVVTYNVMLIGRATLHPDERFNGTIRNAEILFDEMRQRGIAFIQPEFTLGKFKYMKEKGICPSVTTYT